MFRIARPASVFQAAAAIPTRWTEAPRRGIPVWRSKADLSRRQACWWHAARRPVVHRLEASRSRHRPCGSNAGPRLPRRCETRLHPRPASSRAAPSPHWQAARRPLQPRFCSQRCRRGCGYGPWKSVLTIVGPDVVYSRSERSEIDSQNSQRHPKC